MSKTKILELELKKALKAYENGDRKQKRLLEDLYGEKTFQKDITERIQSLNDAINELGENDVEVIEYRKLQKANIAEHILGGQEITIIVKALNEGWEFDLSDNEYGYSPYFERASSGLRYDYYYDWDASTGIGSRHLLKNSKLAKYSGTQFSSTYEKFI